MQFQERIGVYLHIHELGVLGMFYSSPHPEQLSCSLNPI